MALEVGRLVARLELKDDLSAGLGRAQSQMGAAAKSAQQMDAAVGKAGKTGAGLAVSGQAAKQLDTTASMASRLDGQLGKVGLSLGALGTMAGLGGLAAGMSAVIKQGNELTNNLNTLRAAGGATDAQMAQISSTAKQLGADNTIVGASAGSAAAAMTELVKGGMSVDQTMQAARGTLQLAAAAQIEAAQAATIQSSALQAFSLSASDAGRVSDILANAANASSAEIGDVASAMQQAGTVANQFGVDVDDTATAIAMFANAGIKGSDAGTLLKTALLALTDQGNPAQGAMEELGLTVYDMQGKFVGLPSLFEQLSTAQKKMTPEAYQAATAVLFGSDAMRMAGIAAQHGSEGFNTLNDAINKQGGAAAMAEAKTRGLPGAINNLQNQAETAAVSLYEMVDGPLAKLASFSADGLEKVPGALKSVADAAAPVGSAVGTAFDVIPTQVSGALAALVAMRVTGLGDKLTSRIGAAGGALSGLGQSMALSAMYAGDSVRANGVLGASMQGVGKMAGGMKAGIGGIVNMLGGPWMIGLAAAGMAVQDFVSSAQSASQVNDELAAASSASAAAQLDLAAALGASNGEMNSQAIAAGERMVQAEFDKTAAKAGQKHNMIADLGMAIDRIGGDYQTFSGYLDGNYDSMTKAAAASEMAKLEQQALGDATKASGISIDDVNKVVAAGGGEYYKLSEALMATGDAGVAVAADMAHTRNEIESTKTAVANAKDGSYELADAFATIADTASTAEQRTSAMRTALDLLAGNHRDAADATQAHNENITKIAESTQGAWDATKGFGDQLVQNGDQINTTTTNGQQLRDSISGLIDTTLQAKTAGSNMNAVWAANDQALINLSQSSGIHIDTLRKIAEAEGLVKGNVDIVASVTGTDQVTQDLLRVSGELKGVEPGVTIPVKAASEEAIAALRAAGWEVEHLPGEKNMKITASTEAARAGLALTAIAANNIENSDPHVDVSTNTGFVSEALGITADMVRAIPGGHVEITDTTPENIAAINALTGKVHEPKNGVVTINDADVARARGVVMGLNTISTTSQHKVNVSFSNPDFKPSGGGSSGYVDGGIRGPRPFAEGGFNIGGPLPEQALISAPQGPKGLVQWAENETGGEAFIPLAKSKRKRSLGIWQEVGKRLGVDPGKGDMLTKFADGGIMASGLINFAKGVEGQPYKWGGVNWGDCSGAVSAIANYVSGRSPFGSRFATASEREGLADRGFLPGKGGSGDLRVGWVNGGIGGGHTAATLPDGTNFEMGGGRGNGQFGGPAAGANDPQFTDHAYFPMERFADIDASLGEGAFAAISGQLGQGNPDMGPAVDNRTPRQKNIDAIVAEGQRRGMSDRDIQIALMTSEQESNTRILANPNDPESMAFAHEGTGTDGKSSGPFQQQNNGAWGTAADRMDPTKSSGMFYEELAKVQNRESMSMSAAAQAVQKSAYPDAYAKHESTAATELAASKTRLAAATSGTGGGGTAGSGTPVYVTNMPAGGFSGGSSSASSGGGGGGGSTAGGDSILGGAVKPGSLAHFLMTAAGVDQESMLAGVTTKVTGKEKRFDDTTLIEKEGDIVAAREAARIAKVKLDELKNKVDAKGKPVAPSESALAAAELRATEAERKVEKLEHDLSEMKLKAQAVADHNASIGVDTTNYADGGFAGLENHQAQIAGAGSWRVWGEPETGGEAYIPLASHKRARSTAIWLETGKRLGYGIGAGVNLLGSALLGGGLDTGWGGPSLDEVGIDAQALRGVLQPGINSQAEQLGAQVAAAAVQFLTHTQAEIDGALNQVNAGAARARQNYAGALI